MLRRHTVWTLPIAAIMAVGALAAPAHAAPNPTVSDVATPEPGRVTATITSDAPYVRVEMRDGAGGAYTFDDQVLAVAADTHTAQLDRPTWGFPASTKIRVTDCTDPFTWSCDWAAADEETFAPVDVVPTITWSADTKVGPADDLFTVTASDPTGGGSLRAQTEWAGGDSNWWMLQRNGATALDLGDGSIDVTIVRCSDAGTTCRAYDDLTTHVDVNRRVWGWVESVTPEVLGPDDTTAPDAQANLMLPEGSDLTVELRVKDWVSGDVIEGFGGTFTDLTLDGDRRETIPLDLTGIESGHYEMDGTVSYDDPDFGHLEGPINSSSFRVDATAPVVQSVRVSSSEIYPVKDGFKDTVNLTTNATDDAMIRSRWEIRNSAGTVVRALTSSAWWHTNEVVWNGKTSTGGIAPAGKYTVHTIVTDAHGNSTVNDSAKITVSAKRLVNKTFTKTVPARGSMFDKFVGRCSKLATPAGRGWAGSMGLYTGTRCKGKGDAMFVSTAHSARVPDAFRYGTLQITAYGGAGKAEPRSLAYITYLHKKSGWKNHVRLGSSVRGHRGAKVGADSYIFPDRSIGWGVYTGGGARYDIKNFTIKLTYTLLI